MRTDWPEEHRELYLSDPIKGHLWDSTAMGGPGLIATLLLTTIGRRSGEDRLVSLIYGEVDDGYLVVACKGGSPFHPDWYLNLEAEPEVEVQVAARRFMARAEVLRGSWRRHCWELMVRLWPALADFQKNIQREIPVILLRPHQVLLKQGNHS